MGIKKGNNSEVLFPYVEGARSQSTFVADVEAIINAKNIIDRINEFL
jgi:hypothetical protein